MWSALALAAALAGPCPSEPGLESICGPVASEDLARIPGTPWLIASGLNVGTPAHLYLVDTRTQQARVLYPQRRPRVKPDPALRSLCPRPVDPRRMSLDGLTLRSGTGNSATLLAANHGDRHAIEIFRVEMRPEPALTWVGCVPMPKGALANAVVPLANGGMLVTSFHDPDDPEAWNRMDRGEATGRVWEWQPGSGWKSLAIGGIPGANGIETDADGRMLYVSAWAASQLLLVDRASGAIRTVPLGFRPDNIHRAPDGTLLVGGQRAAVRDIAACGAQCPQPWVIARIDPVTERVTILLEGPGSTTINYACGAIQVEDRLYITLRGAPIIALKALAP